MVAPDCELLNVSDFRVGLECELSKGTIVIKTGHGSKVLSGDAGSIVLADQSVGVGWVSDNNSLSSALSVVVDRLASINEDLTVVLKEVGTFHARSTWLGTNEEVEVNIFEGNLEVTGDDNVVKKGEGTVVKLGLDTLKSVLGVGKIEQVENDSLVGSEERTTTNNTRLVIMFFFIQSTYLAILNRIE